MSIHKVKRQRGHGYEVRYWDGPKKKSKTFDRRGDAEVFENDIRRRKRLGTLADIDAGTELLCDFAQDWFRLRVAQKTLAPVTHRRYAEVWDKHVLPRIGGYQLREIRPALVEDLATDLLADGVGAPTVRKALFMLQSIMGAAARRDLVAANPVKLVQKPRQGRKTVRPLAPETVEAIRGQLEHRDRTLVSVMAYAGLRPGEALALTWGKVRDRTLLVDQAISLGEEKGTKTDQVGTVNLVAPLAQDLAEWKLASGRPADNTLVFPRRDGQPWSDTDWRNWRRRTFRLACGYAGLTTYRPPWTKTNPAWSKDRPYDGPRPYDLRHSFCSLLIHEGVSIPEIARQMRHANATMTLGTYSHVFEEFDPTERVPAEEMIRRARAPKKARRKAS